MFLEGGGNLAIAESEVILQFSDNREILNIIVPENETYDLDLSREEFSSVNTINKVGEGDLNILKLKTEKNLNLEGGVTHLKNIFVNNKYDNSISINNFKLKNTSFINDDLEVYYNEDGVIKKYEEMTQEPNISYGDVILENSNLELNNSAFFNHESIRKEGDGKVVFNFNKKFENVDDGVFVTGFDFQDNIEREIRNLTLLNTFNNKDEIVIDKNVESTIWSNYGGGSLDLGNIKFKTTEKDQNYSFLNRTNRITDIEEKNKNPNGKINIFTHRQYLDKEHPEWELRVNGDNFKEYYGTLHSFIFPVNIINGNLENTELNITSQDDDGDLLYLKATARPVKIFNLKTEGGIVVDIDNDDNYTQYQVKKDVVFYKKHHTQKFIDHYYPDGDYQSNLYTTLKINVKDGIKLNRNRFENIISSEEGNVLFYKESFDYDEESGNNVRNIEEDVKQFQRVTDNSLLYDFIPEYYDNHIDLKVVKLEEDDESSDPDDSDSHASTEEHPNQNEPSIGNTDNTTTDTTHVNSPSQSKQLEKIIKKRNKRADLLTETNLVPYLDNLLNKAESIESVEDEINLTEEQQLAKQAKTHFIRIEKEEEVEKVVEETLPIENLLDRERVFRQLHKINSFTHRHQLQFGNQKLQKLLNSCQSNQNNNWYGNLLAEKGKFGHGLNNLKTYDYGFTLGLDKALDETENCKDFKDLDDRITKIKQPKLDGLGFNFSVIKGTGKTEKTQFENLNFIASIYGNKILREYYDIELLSQASLGYSQSKLTNNYDFYQTQSTQKPDYLLGSLSLGLAKEFKLIENDNMSLLLKPYSFLTYQALSASSTHNKIVDESKDKLLDYSINKHYQQTLSQEIGVMQQFTLKELTKLNLKTGLSLTFDWLNSAKPLHFQHLDKTQHFLNTQHEDKGLKTVKSLKGFVDISYQLNPMTTINSYYQFEKGLKNNNSYQHQIGVGLEIKY